jgi:1A family penicillin-binding protein
MVTGGYLFWQVADDAERAAAAFALNSGAQLTTMYDAQDRAVFTLFIEQRTDVSLSRVSPHLIAAVLTAEDRRFFRHSGFDPGRVISAAFANARAGHIVEGGSTITQQLVRMTDGDYARTFRRKLREALLARAIERRFSKDAILQTYLNKVYLGEGFYGAEAAAHGYFGKAAADLTAEESATLAALIQSPVRYTQEPFAARVLARRNWILAEMGRQHALSDAAAREAIALPLRVTPIAIAAPATTSASASTTTPAASSRAAITAACSEPGEACATASGLYFKEAVRQQLTKMLPSAQVFAGGLRVYTTIDMAMQTAAEHAVRDRLETLERTEQKANAHVVPGSDRGKNDKNEKNDTSDKTSTSDKSSKNGKSGKKGAEPDTLGPLQGSLVSIDPDTGYVKALVGGRSFAESPFDRARQAHRQPGSAFKPLVYASALEMGLEPGTLLHDLDQPIAFGAHQEYLPRDMHAATEMTMRDALVLSSNRAAVHLQQQVGLASVLDYAQRLGVTSRLPEVPSLALGSGEVTLMELTSAYAVFANQGVRVNPILIRRIETADGRVLFRADVERHRVIREETAFLMTSMLSDVIARGTGTEVRRSGFTQPAAGKTGTTNGFADAWFIGFTPRLATGVWIGRDDPHQIRKGGFAAVIAVPAWTAFMKAATQGQRGEPFSQPPGLERVAYCRLSGERAGPGCDIYYDLARTDDTGTQCTLHTDDGRRIGVGTVTIAEGDTIRTIQIAPKPGAASASPNSNSGGGLSSLGGLPSLALTPAQALEIWRSKQ